MRLSLFLLRARLKLLCAAPVFILLLALGVWQLQRLAWKENLIAQIQARAAAPASELPPAQAWGMLDAQQWEYRHVVVTGHYLQGLEAAVFRTKVGARAGDHPPGYLLIAPLELADGAHVMINRGFVPDFARAKSAHQAPPEGLVEIKGLWRAPESRSWFTPADPTGPNPADNAIWFTRDPITIAASLGLETTLKGMHPLAPFIIDADGDGARALEPAPPLNSEAQAHSPIAPVGGQSTLIIPNNHLGYAVTWFGLALALAFVLLASLWQDWAFVSAHQEGAG